MVTMKRNCGKFLSMLMETNRLILRPFAEKDRARFAHINGDPQVMRFFPAPLTPAQSDQLIEKIEAHRQQYGFSLNALETKQDAQLIGFVGLINVDFAAHFTPAIEIGWRLAATAWGKAYAPEAARLCLSDGFANYDFSEIISFTSKANHPSRRVMEKIGMSYLADADFHHPKLAKNHILAPHVLYKINRKEGIK